MTRQWIGVNKLWIIVFLPNMYTLLRNILFWFDAEEVHYFSMYLLKMMCRVGFLRQLIERYCAVQPGVQPVKAFGLEFPNVAGLGAGFDKNAKYLDELEALGFGCVEVGTITPKPQPGNERPRLFRLPKDKALINRMGFNNEGADVIAERLRQWKQKKHALIIGGNIGKNKATPNEEAWRDYDYCFDALHPWVDYFVVNVSSPNTPGLRELQEKDALRKILTHLQEKNFRLQVKRPILLKIAPDLTLPQIDDIIELAKEIQLDGLVVSNTTLDRSALSAASQQTAEKIGAGGLSGWPLKEKSSNLIRYMRNKLPENIQIIGSGGIFTATDAQEKINAGAVLIQVWTGFIYEGPTIVKQICKAAN